MIGIFKMILKKGILLYIWWAFTGKSIPDGWFVDTNALFYALFGYLLDKITIILNGYSCHFAHVFFGFFTSVFQSSF